MPHLDTREPRRLASIALLFVGLLALVLLPRPTAGSGEPPGPPEPVEVDAVLDPGLAPLRRGEPGLPAPAPAFAVALDGRPVQFSLTSIPVLPGGSVHVATGGPGARLTHQAGVVRSGAGGSWHWRAPSRPGAYAMRVDLDGASVHLVALVMHPAERVRGGRLRGYAIGEYVSTPLRGNPAYLPPRGFIEVAEADAGILVSPRLTLGQFLCKQPGDPRYVALSTALLVKVEAIMDRLALAGMDPASLVVMSGFRTPSYNRAIGNTTVYSRHLWGDAADIYLDGDGDGIMDDLNGDGRSDEGDARVLAGVVEEVVKTREDVRAGGLATYRANAVHGPFVHVDARGHRARW